MVAKEFRAVVKELFLQGKIRSKNANKDYLNERQINADEFEITLLNTIKSEVIERMRNAADNLRSKQIFNDEQTSKYFISGKSIRV